MAINLNNVNISLRQFQDISSGKYNAGEVKLTSETQIDKVNNHVKMKFLNNTSISHVEVLAVKNAFVKALKSGGVGGDEINRIRQELGLSPMKSVDKTLHERSIKPLSRQQIREILDRNADTINSNAGAETIRTCQQIHADVSEQKLASRGAKRDTANAELETRRDVVENKALSDIQAVLAGDVDFASPNERKEFLETAKQCLDNVLDDCNDNPRDNIKASIKWTTPGGNAMKLFSGLTEKALVRKLEDIIVRLQMRDVPSRAQISFRNEFKTCTTPEARARWADSLAQDPKAALKARTIAVMIMHEHGIVDAETLAVVNNLKNDHAVAFAVSLVHNAMEMEGDALRQSEAVQWALAHADPDLILHPAELTFIPAISDQQYNQEIANGMTRSPEKLPVTYKRLINAAADAVHSRYGDVGYPPHANQMYLTSDPVPWSLTRAADPSAPRITPETLREPYINGVLTAGANRVIAAGLASRLRSAGVQVENLKLVADALRASEPAIQERVLAAETLEDADAVLNGYADKIMASAQRVATCTRCAGALDAQAREALAVKLGVSPASLSKEVFTTENLTVKGTALTRTICNGENMANSVDEIEAEYRKLVDTFIDERVAILAKIDSADIHPEAKAAVKARLLRMDKVNYINVDAFVAASKAISTDRLASLLANSAPKAEIFAAMDEIKTAAFAFANNQIFAQAIQQGKEIGPDEYANVIDTLLYIIVLPKQGMEVNLANFLASDAVAGKDIFDSEAEEYPASSYMIFMARPDANALLAEKLGTDELPAFHTLALVSAAHEEGLADLTAAETLALFKPGQPAGDALKMSVKGSEAPVRASSLETLARIAIRNMRQNKAAAETAERQFLEGDGATRARDAGYHASELPRIAKAFALYKVATNATDEDALAAVLDPASRASRLISYGGRFTESAEGFRAGLALMDKFAQWYANLATDVADDKFDTVTKVNAKKGYVQLNAVKGYELFVFQDLAIRPDVNLDEPDPEKLFGVEHNDAVNFFARGNGDACTGTLKELPPARRQVVYSAFRAIEPPKTERRGLPNVYNNAGYLARILRHFDEVANLQATAKLDRAHLNAILTPDLDLPPDASSRLVDDAIQSRIYELYAHSPGKIVEVSSFLTESGYTITEAMDAVAAGEKPVALGDISSTQMAIYQIDGTTNGGRSSMLGDLCRPNNVSYIGSKQNVIPPENCHFTVQIGGETIQCVTGSNNAAANAHIADKIENLCGKVHIEQASTVMRGLAQGAHAPILSILSQHGIVNGIGVEHMALTYALTKNDETGAVTIHYSEPQGFPFKFSWETTVALDGTSTTTPIVVDAPL